MHVQDAALRNQTAAALRETWAPKAAAATALLVAAANTPLTAAVMFSSVAGSLGSAGQAAYGAANAALDGLAEASHQQVRLQVCPSDLLKGFCKASTLWQGSAALSGLDEALSEQLCESDAYCID